ncbi:hypothetical protein [Stakelama tenebrarum]|uniref:DUF4350 domain-containing protein n=1 Tax=Stakelama tenebrarum TaxID=2711215 RepID=A0A6G6Y786_9SPHN|nr:hypothetical protein [Sphingosinithalassobacter tenebrarum]QIG80657.1 hypothetical protein G5C33_13295 [Sphingosinithalassobacter tenebrarum]
MSDIAIDKGERRGIFNPLTVGLILLIGIVGFVGVTVLSAYAPDLRSQNRVGGHALSKGATGFSGLVQLAAATGRNPQILREERLWESEDLIVVTPENAATDIGRIGEFREGYRPTLYILPKWDVVPDEAHRGWVNSRGLLPEAQPEGVFAPRFHFDIRRHEERPAQLIDVDGILPGGIVFTIPEKLQVITAASAYSDDYYENLEPLITDGEGGIVLGIQDSRFILSDPDLLNNTGMKDATNAASALALLDWMNSTNAESIGFDVVSNGIGGTKSILRLAFDPPFLAMTLALVAVIILLGFRAFGQFGAPQRRQRALAFGKAALVDNGAMLVRKARLTRQMGGRYAQVIRDQAVRTFGVSSRLAPVEVDAYLDGLEGKARFTELADVADAAGNDTELLAAARALHDWKQEKLSDD